MRRMAGVTRHPACSLAHSDGTVHLDCVRCAALADMALRVASEMVARNVGVREAVDALIAEPDTLPYLPEVES